MQPRQIQSDLLEYYRSKQGRIDLASMAVGLLGILFRSRIAIVLSIASFRLFSYPVRVATAWRETGRLDHRFDESNTESVRAELAGLQERVEHLSKSVAAAQEALHDELDRQRSTNAQSTMAIVGRLDAIERTALDSRSVGPS